MISGFCNSNPGIYLGFFMPAVFNLAFVSALLVHCLPSAIVMFTTA
ncbi:hypothetical protein VCHA47P369_20410 [Vibrio chagasii]|nr:hypothetical protein VCHA27O13_320005 [Vibrio chagasii]CAH6798435.1 hypothetical protein VCHA31O73_110066 [Vibrio chagasii]CAH6802860.1 hypothetical protein VCHA35O143_110081 [Vibrio chagasii]CAH6803219.1 hypothetical protein VCHA34P114_110152 [Vibrio chagasii]CAH6809627.1 hypothetical protein VCHA35O142_130014 [Vibrio chagasii]